MRVSVRVRMTKDRRPKAISATTGFLLLVQVAKIAQITRPTCRSDCRHGVRPCPWVGCRYHLLLEVLSNGKIKYNFPGKEFDEIPETCALDVADRGVHTLDQVGNYLNLVRERVRQIENDVITELRSNRELVGIHNEHASET